jgi:hypothetical protein
MCIAIVYLIVGLVRAGLVESAAVYEVLRQMLPFFQTKQFMLVILSEVACRAVTVWSRREESVMVLRLSLNESALFRRAT